MNLKIMDYSVSVIAYEKKNQKKGMCCAWAMQADYDKLLCLLGSQSDTAKEIKKGDLIGVSVLSKNQKDIALHFGEGHSNELDKFVGMNVHQKETALTVPEAARELVCKVIDVLHLEKIEVDSLLYLEIVDVKENGEDFLHYSEM